MGAPAGWYDDGSGRHRWWDGQNWTEHLRDLPQQPAPPEPAPVKSGPATESEPGILGRFGASVKKAATDRQAAKDEDRRQHAAREQAAGRLVTSGVFGLSTVEIYQGGYVRVAGPSDTSSPARIDKKAPYEKLLSITFTPSEQEKPTTATPAAWEGAAVRAVSSLFKGGAGAMKASAPGLAVAGVAQIAKSMSGKSFLDVATDKEIHSLTNQVPNDLGIPTVKKEHEGVGRTLEQVGNSILKELGVVVHEPASHSQPVTALSTGGLNQEATVDQAAVSTPGLTVRLRELASLHADGILDDAEFAAAKAKLLDTL